MSAPAPATTDIAAKLPLNAAAQCSKQGTAKETAAQPANASKTHSEHPPASKENAAQPAPQAQTATTQTQTPSIHVIRQHAYANTQPPANQTAQAKPAEATDAQATAEPAKQDTPATADNAHACPTAQEKPVTATAVAAHAAHA